MFEKTKINEKEAGVGPFKKILYEVDSWLTMHKELSSMDSSIPVYLVGL